MNGKVLLVDDSPTIREIVKVYLMGRSLDFVDAENAERALTLLGLVQPISLVVADIKLPGMSGVELVKQMRSSRNVQIRAIPVILLTGQTGGQLREQGLAAGANAFLQKPITSTALNDLLTNLLPPPEAKGAANS